MGLSKLFNRINWSKNTPLAPSNLNKVDKGLDDIDNRLVTYGDKVDTLESTVSSLNSNIDNKLDIEDFRVKYSTAITDCNYMFRGIFTTNTALNRPSDSWCAILSMPINDKYNLQIAMVLGSTNLYVRSSNKGTYSAWRKI